MHKDVNPSCWDLHKTLYTYCINKVFDLKANPCWEKKSLKFFQNPTNQVNDRQSTPKLLIREGKYLSTNPVSDNLRAKDFKNTALIDGKRFSS
ncbi:hypothetical protein CEXT_44671 [Caerostris extrusa]|uniref:Uncharacterized protein n=1 Tax=Caerostris extrusa TaxID=172846 RepID=A0AAV4QK77_CAEEX|nr:hypothetical protein CEXT_44671 [Caerostris extrusa]